MTDINPFNGVDRGHERGHWMTVSDGLTYSRFYPLDPRPDEINIGIIAHHLSNLCRYTGATSRFFSIAEHSIAVADQVETQMGGRDPQTVLTALLHDATEAIVNDINRPLKTTEEMVYYRAIEQRVWRQAIAPRFGLPLDMPSIIHEVDIKMAATEKRDLLPGSEEWINMPEPYLYVDFLTPMDPHEAKSRFLARFWQIMEVLG